MVCSRDMCSGSSGYITWSLDTGTMELVSVTSCWGWPVITASGGWLMLIPSPSTSLTHSFMIRLLLQSQLTTFWSWQVWYAELARSQLLPTCEQLHQRHDVGIDKIERHFITREENFPLTCAVLFVMWVQWVVMVRWWPAVVPAGDLSHHHTVTAMSHCHTDHIISGLPLVTCYLIPSVGWCSSADQEVVSVK